MPSRHRFVSRRSDDQDSCGRGWARSTRTAAIDPGDASDKTTAPDLVGPLSLTGDVVGDRGYFGRAEIGANEATSATAYIPSQSNVCVNRTVDRDLYRERNRVERFLNILKHLRGIATRYFKIVAN
ncbi:transposase [Rhodophyticola sp.]|jgi:hypothetical protein|uniref:transposase n=1 Tax=Rhodophyticola sp. TaxID=2680032 RepID=UPI003D28EF52